MTITADDSATRRLYEAAALTLASGLHADRTVIVYRDGDKGLTLGGFHGFAKDSLNPLKVSEAILTQAAVEGRTIMCSDARQDHEVDQNLSLQLSGSVSLICIPFFDGQGYPIGALYADTIGRVGVFRRKELMFARECALWLEGSLNRDPKAAASFPPRVLLEQLEVSPLPAPPPAEDRLPSEGKSRRERLSAVSRDSAQPASLMVFFRGLATLTKAGVVIHHSLALLGNSAEEPAMRRVAQRLSSAVLRGEPLSAAMEHFPNAFSPYLRSSIRVGERTGRLVNVLDVLALDLEKGQQMTMRLRSALTYPLFLSVACGLLLLLGPPYMLAGQLNVLKQSRIPLPWYTSVLVILSEAMRGPLFWLALIILGSVALLWVRRKDSRQKLARWSLAVPVVGRILRLASLVRFARSLSLQLKAGLTVFEALTHAGQGSTDPALRIALRQAEERLRDGDGLTESLAFSRHFPPTFLSFVEAGESSGTLERLTSWVADFYERELELALDSMLSLVEPVLISLMGLLTAVLLIATMKPTLMLLQTL